MFFLILITSLADLTHAGDPKVCEGAVSNQPVLTSLSESWKIEIPAEMRTAILDHPGFRALAEKYGDGNDVTFALSDYFPDANVSLNDRSRSRVGEAIQSAFIAAVLKARFPGCTVKKGPDSGYLLPSNIDDPVINFHKEGQRVTAYLRVDDRIEDSQQSPAAIVDMAIIKPANGVWQSIGKSEVRGAFGFGDTDRVASLYIDQLFIRERDGRKIDPDLWGVVTSPRFNRVFVSTTQTSQFDGFEKFEEMYGEPLEKLGVGLIKLSDFVPSNVPKGRVVIFNNTRGRMPWIHASSDVTIVRGPISIFESLSVGTPTVLILDTDAPLELDGMPNYAAHYQQSVVYQQSLAVAQSTGIFRVASSVEALPGTLDLPLGTFTPPWQVVKANGKSALDIFLDHLHQLLTGVGL